MVRGKWARYRVGLVAASFLFILLLSMTGMGRASSSSLFQNSPATIDASQNGLRLNYQLMVFENLTSISAMKASLVGSNSTQAMKSIEAAMRRLEPSIRLDPSQFRLDVGTALVDSGQSMWAVEENVTAVVDGAASVSSGIVSYDLTFVSMNMSDPLQVNGMEFNNVGRAVLLPSVLSQPSGITSYFADGGGPYSNTVIPGNVTIRFNMLDFSRVPQISQWDGKYQPLAGSSFWTYDTSKLIGGSLYNVTYGLRSPEFVFFKAYTGWYRPVLTLTAPARAWVAGAALSFNVPSLYDVFPPLIIIVGLAVGIVAYVGERRTLRTTPGPARKKKRA